MRSLTSKLRSIGLSLRAWAAAPRLPVWLHRRRARRSPRVLREVIPYLTELDEVVEERPPRHLRGVGFAVMALCALITLGASIVHVDIIVQATGELATETPPIVLQPMERSIIRTLNVRLGDMVTKGQVLATLDPTFTEADVATLTAQQTSLSAQIMRITSELDGADYQITGPADTDQTMQHAVFLQRKAHYAARIKAFDEEISRLEATVRTNQNNRTLLAEQLQVAAEIEGMRTKLYAAQTGSRLNLLDSKNSRLRVEREYQETGDKLTELQHTIAAKRAERQSFVDEWRGQLLSELVKLRLEASKIQEGLAKANRMHDLIVISAPDDGVVLHIAQRSVGSVLREAEPLVSIVPSKAILIADVRINSGDVGYIKVGDEAKVKVDAFPYQRHGLLPGRLISVSEESFSSNSPAAAASMEDSAVGSRPSVGGAFHRGRIEILDMKLEKMPPGAKPIPGMTVTVEIKVGARSVISYFLYPITRGFEESAREP
jgi:hemolysin D